MELHRPFKPPAVEGLDPNRPYLISTIHRHEALLNHEQFFGETFGPDDSRSVDFPRPGDGDQEALPNMVQALNEISRTRDMQVVFILYGGTKQALERNDLQFDDDVICIDPLDVEDYWGLLQYSNGVITDSSGIGAEAAYMNKPVLLLLNEGTHRKDVITPISRIGGVRSETILKAYAELEPYFQTDRPLPNRYEQETLNELKRLAQFLVATANGKKIPLRHHVSQIGSMLINGTRSAGSSLHQITR